MLAHCYDVLKNEEKWKNRDGLEVPKKGKTVEAVVLDDDDDDDASSDDAKRSLTPNSVAYSKPKRPIGGKQAKERKKKGGGDEIKSDMDAMVKARVEAKEDRKMAEERRVAAEERRVALEEKKFQIEEQARQIEYEKHLFFMDMSTLDDKQKEYVNLCREQLLVQKRMQANMGAKAGSMGVMGGIGGSMGVIRLKHIYNF